VRVGAFGGLCQVGLSKVNVQLVDKLTPITRIDGSGIDQGRLPPEHGNVGEVRRSERHSLLVSRELARPTVKGHDTADQ